MENTLSTITALPANKAEMKTYIQSCKNEILSGIREPLLILKHLKIVESTIKQLLKDEEIKNEFHSDAMKYGDKTIKNHGAEFQLRGGKPSYNFDVCKDSEYDILKTNFEIAKSKKEARENFLKGLSEERILQDTGEVIYPPEKKQATVIAVTLK